MVTNVWNKYLPVIKILLKRSKSGEQQLAINQSDFEKAGLARKTGNKFSLLFKNGRVDDIVISSVVAADLAASLMQDDGIKSLFAEHDYRIAMNTKYLLTIAQIDKEEGTEAEALEVSNHA